jgi:hypothetical protein
MTYQSRKDVGLFLDLSALISLWKSATFIAVVSSSFYRTIRNSIGKLFEGIQR